ncbi:MAG: tRNA (guanosine(37)-N1)-methyltransferase TrmD [Culicoidibacterales bacterium]
MKKKLHIDVLTLFPGMFEQVLNTSILGRAKEDGKFSVSLHNFRDFSLNPHKKVDDYPYGGGAGLVLTVQPIFDALEHVLAQKETTPPIIMLTPQGEPFTHEIALQLAKEEHLVFICGHYEGFDERVREHLVTRELSLGDFVLTGGEIASMAMIDATVRLRPDVILQQSHEDDSFANGLLEYPHYTRPQNFNGWEVPEVLTSGHHERISKWRQQESMDRTRKRRPDLLDK